MLLGLNLSLSSLLLSLTNSGKLILFLLLLGSRGIRVLLVLLSLLRLLLVECINVLRSEGELLGSGLLQFLGLLREVSLGLRIVELRLLGLLVGILGLSLLNELLLLVQLLLLEIGLQVVTTKELSLELVLELILGSGRLLLDGLNCRLGIRLSLLQLLLLLLLLLGKGTSGLDQSGTISIVGIPVSSVIPDIGLLQRRSLQRERVHVGLLTNGQLGL